MRQSSCNGQWRFSGHCPACLGYSRTVTSRWDRPSPAAIPGAGPGSRSFLTKTTWPAPLSRPAQPGRTGRVGCGVPGTIRALDGLALAFSLIGIALAWLPPNQRFAHEVKAVGEADRTAKPTPAHVTCQGRAAPAVSPLGRGLDELVHTMCVSGVVVKVRPDGVVQVKVPGVCWCSFQPGWCLMMWWVRQRLPRLQRQVRPPSSNGMVWSRSACRAGWRQTGNRQVRSRAVM